MDEDVCALRKPEVDVLVNNAGIYPATPFLEMGWEEWQRVLNINLNSIFHFTKAFLPGMVASGWGRLISVSSTTFRSGIGLNTHYTASKGGVIGFSRSLAAEVGVQGVTVNTIARGLVRTATTAGGPELNGSTHWPSSKPSNVPSSPLISSAHCPS